MNTSSEHPQKVRILFVCLGNICRSPAAHAVFQRLAESRGGSQRYAVDSAGILDYHEGELPDPRMRAAAARRGYDLTHRARPVCPDDFSRFDHIVAMDQKVLTKLKNLARDEHVAQHRARLSLFLDHVDNAYRGQDVPDPYWSGEDGFEHVMDLIELGCEALLRKLDGVEAAE